MVRVGAHASADGPGAQPPPSARPPAQIRKCQVQTTSNQNTSNQIPCRLSSVDPKGWSASIGALAEVNGSSDSDGVDCAHRTTIEPRTRQLGLPA